MSYIIESFVGDNVTSFWEPCIELGEYETEADAEHEIQLAKNIEFPYDEPEWNGTLYRVVEVS